MYYVPQNMCAFREINKLTFRSHKGFCQDYPLEKKKKKKSIPNILVVLFCSFNSWHTANVTWTRKLDTDSIRLMNWINEIESFSDARRFLDLHFVIQEKFVAQSFPHSYIFWWILSKTEVSTEYRLKFKSIIFSFIWLRWS